ncbi:MAG: hypothetical protein Q4C70_12065 [Planctomycetia bacterium]|nr:hypothetical protein [Planctomycetia bacterium]
MFFVNQFKFFIFCALSVVLVTCAGGCGTSKLTNTSRTATEQLLLTDAMDRAVSQVNLSVLSGRKVFINATAIGSVQDNAYLLSIVRQHALASGCLLVDEEENSEIILELHAGSSGTDQHDTMFGISEMTIPGFGSYSATTVPEVAIAKRVIQKATVKIGIFAYTREGRRPIWQSGNLIAESKAKNRWLFGMGPYQSGDIYDQSTFIGTDLTIPLIDTENRTEGEFVSVSSPAFFRQNLEAEQRAKAEEEEKLRKEAEEKARIEAETKAKAYAEMKIKAEAEAKIRLEARTKAEAEAKAKAETENKVKTDELATAPEAKTVQPATAVGSPVTLPATNTGLLSPPVLPTE